MARATTDNVATRLMRPLTDLERSAAFEFLEDVEADILDVYPDILTAGTARQQRKVVQVECDAVIRVLRNPEGMRQISRTRQIDDWTETDSGTIASDVVVGLLALTDAEWKMLAPAEVSTAEAFTIRPYFQPGFAR